MLYNLSLQLVGIFSNARAHKAIELWLLSHASGQNFVRAAELSFQHSLDGAEDEWRHDLQNEVEKHGRHVLDVRVQVGDY